MRKINPDFEESFEIITKQLIVTDFYGKKTFLFSIGFLRCLNLYTFCLREFSFYSSILSSLNLKE